MIISDRIDDAFRGFGTNLEKRPHKIHFIHRRISQLVDVFGRDHEPLTKWTWNIKRFPFTLFIPSAFSP